MTGKENPADWNSRHPEDIRKWSEEERRKHEVDEGEEIRLNRVTAIRKLERVLEEGPQVRYEERYKIPNLNGWWGWGGVKSCLQASDVASGSNSEIVN